MKTPFRKNLDTRYISGEDLKNGIELGKGLKPEMIVTLAKWEDAPAFDQKKQAEVDKTAIWLKEYQTGKMLYKPCLLGVNRATFLSKELANGSMFIDDCDFTKPFVIYAQADRRHGHVVAFKKYFAPATVTDTNALAILDTCKTLDELRDKYQSLSKAEQALPTVVAKKDQLKTKFENDSKV